MEHIQVRIKGIRQETRDCKSYVVEAVNGSKIDYKAGQFLTVIVQLHGQEVRRSYSICSCPGVDEDLFFAIKRVENGELSRYLLDTLQVDDIIECLPPTGRFVIDTPDSDQSVFIAAGSGITPCFSLIKHLLYNFSHHRVLLIYQNRDEEEAIFQDELVGLTQQFPSFTLHEVYSSPRDHHTHHSLRLNNNLLERLLLQYVEQRSVRFYLCGPESFMRMAEFTLKVMGYNQELIRKENFYAVAPPPPFMVDKTPHEVTIHFRGKTEKIQVGYPSNILEVALKHHIKLPFSCRGGRCSTCTARCTSGKVKMSINDVLTPKDLADGLILPCVAYPETDVEIRYEELSITKDETD